LINYIFYINYKYIAPRHHVGEFLNEQAPHTIS